MNGLWKNADFWVNHFYYVPPRSTDVLYTSYFGLTSKYVSISINCKSKNSCVFFFIYNNNDCLSKSAILHYITFEWGYIFTAMSRATAYIIIFYFIIFRNGNLTKKYNTVSKRFLIKYIHGTNVHCKHVYCLYSVFNTCTVRCRWITTLFSLQHAIFKR